MRSTWDLLQSTRVDDTSAELSGSFDRLSVELRDVGILLLFQLRSAPRCLRAALLRVLSHAGHADTALRPQAVPVALLTDRAGNVQ